MHVLSRGLVREWLHALLVEVWQLPKQKEEDWGTAERIKAGNKKLTVPTSHWVKQTFLLLSDEPVDMLESLEDCSSE